jgi:SAM-dependent methyltransferase
MDDNGFFYKKKEDAYFANVRQEILPLLPSYSDRIFELGCGSGGTLAFLKSLGRCEWCGGIEIFPEAAETAKGKLDLVLVGSAETSDLPFEKRSLDVILCLDVLEHLIDPWAVVHRMHEYLKPGGVLICSIPNVRNIRVVLPLLLLGKWEYSKEGILDKTHLRFFTKRSAVELVGCSGLSIDKVLSTGLEKGRKGRFYNRLTFGLLRPFFEFQYLIRAVNEK